MAASGPGDRDANGGDDTQKTPSTENVDTSPSGWQADPTGRYALRYEGPDGWTDQVSNGAGVQLHGPGWCRDDGTDHATRGEHRTPDEQPAGHGDVA